MRVVLTREAGHNADLAARLAPLGEVVEVPVTETHYLDPGSVREATAELAPREVVVTSARAAAYAAGLGGVRVLAVGPATAQALTEVGVEVDVVGDAGGADLARAVRSDPVLVLGAAAPREELGRALTEARWRWRHVACYETVALALSPAQVATVHGAQVVVVGAPSGWAVVGPHVDPRALVVVPGLTTAEVVRDSHSRVLVGWEGDLAARVAESAARDAR